MARVYATFLVLLCACAPFAALGQPHALPARIATKIAPMRPVESIQLRRGKTVDVYSNGLVASKDRRGQLEKIGVVTPDSIPNPKLGPRAFRLQKSLLETQLARNSAPPFARDHIIVA